MSRKHSTVLKPNASAFDDSDESSSDEKQTSSKVSASIDCDKIRKQTLLEMEKALCEDPSVFEYDSVYDEMKKDRTETKKEKEARNPRYIGTLLKTAESRKKEQERRLERRIQKERENEGDQFKDKDSFVTSAYKEKLLEMESEKEKEVREQQIEEILDVKKQKDLSGFYRHLFDQSTTNTSNKEKSEDKEIKDEKDEKREKPTFNAKKINRSLRRRDSISSHSSDSSDVEMETTKEAQSHQIKRVNEFQKHEGIQRRRSYTPIMNREEEMKNQEKQEQESDDESKILEDKTMDQKEDSDTKGAKEKIDRKEFIMQLFKKRTVGEVFEEARKRYLIRKESLK
ncbi:nuclear speckle splicing regulatory protein 1-like isoform X1 [Dinothrombium tinctorium]|uniref:Nuclear speckle splicing regulatory protein 1-like isoform X1 n=1 Tax=Dinothrombium tinctorium TaxID=1965070 RepID=A0A3S3PHX0_9ACAR|nr:nuclear speckle splicing regulatory protein 1-like isoform X1 [Dinothrombium tinctorium]RWS12794.1 nuclear speckle splicing regulatory protein 1-like isoform X1 [Dinothrombium tinctorium]RWS16786.1 nuclear speckle splicing regulatory protein 1-like isoform X1 [Dinothrombium tinctorium]